MRRECVWCFWGPSELRGRSIGCEGESGPVVTAVDGAEAEFLVVVRGVQRG